MTTRLINFTTGEAQALLHFLRQAPEAVGPMLTDADRWPPLWVTAHCVAMARTLTGPAPFVTLHPEHEITRRALDLAILRAAVEHSTYHKSRPWTVDGRENGQAYNGAVRCLYNARAKIAAAFGLDPEAIPFPQV